MVSNVAPVVNAGSDQSVDEGTTVSFAGSFTDAGTADTHTILWDFGDGASGSGTLTPSHAYADNGTYTVTLTVTDDDGAEISDTLVLTVSNVAPVVNAGLDQTADEGTTVNFAGLFTDAGSADTHAIAWDFGDGATASGALDPTHAYADNGTYTVTLTVTDDDGAAISDTLILTVNNVAPVAGPEACSVNEDEPLVVLLPGVLANDTDVPADTLSAVLVSDVSHGALALNADGSFSYTPAANFFGIDSFAYRARDDDGTLSNVATVTITVAEVNDAPLAVNDAVTTQEDAAVTGNVLANDSDPDNTDGIPGNEDTLSVELVSDVSYGALVLNADGTFVYTPSADCAQDDQFTYQVRDSRGLAGNIATVTIAVAPAVAEGAAVLGSDGILRIGGTSAADAIVARRTADGQSIEVSINTVLAVFPISQVSKIRAWGRQGNDRVELVDLAIESMLHGGCGDDELIGAAGSDLILGGLGNDKLTGAAGNDMLIGGDGTDRIVGSAGHDILVAGKVACSLTAGDLWAVLADWVLGKADDTWSGDDLLDETLITDTDYDQLTGSSGADWFIINTGDKITDFKARSSDGDLVTVIS